MGVGRPCVCIPACNEAERLPRLVDALARQSDLIEIPLIVIVLVNNSTDDSLAVLEVAREAAGERLDLRVDSLDFPVAFRHAGAARREVMRRGASLLVDLGARDGVLITTDADAVPPPDWIAANVRAMREGVGLIGGRLVIDPSETAEWPAELRALHRTIGEYWSAVRDLEDRLDPVSWDPPPRHGDHTGGSLTVRLAVHEAVGGVPALPTGEDTAFVRLARMAGARLRHPPDVWIGISPREEGRAVGGMADDMRRLRSGTKGGEPVRLPSASAWVERFEWRRSLRDRRSNADGVIAELEPSQPTILADSTAEDALLSVRIAVQTISETRPPSAA